MKGTLFGIGIVLIVIGLGKIIYALYLRHKERDDV